MLRYSGEDLGSSPHIVVLGSCKVGNLIVSIPALEGLRRRFPQAVIGFLGSSITADLEAALQWIDWRCSWDEECSFALNRLADEIALRCRRHGDVALAVNLDGFNPVTQVLASFLSPVYIAGGSLSLNRRGPMDWGQQPRHAFLADVDWDSADFLERYGGIFRTNYIAELFAGLAWVSDYCDYSAIILPQAPPPFAVPDVLIHCTTARAAKIWPFEFWKQVVDALDGFGLSVGLVGSEPKQQQLAYNSGDGEGWLLASTRCVDLRGQTSLLQLAGACAQARAVITVDAGPLHIAAAVGTPTMAVVGNDADGDGASPIRLWMPRSPNVTRTVAGISCTACSEVRFGNDRCLMDQHVCMLSVEPAQVITWIRQLFYD